MVDLTRAQQIGQSLGAFGAGVQGNLPQFQAQQAQQQQFQLKQQEQLQKQQQQQRDTRQISAITDADAALTLLDAGNLTGLVQLSKNRLQQLGQFGSDDPSGTQRLHNLAVAVRNGSKKAEKLLRPELEGLRTLGRSLGILEAPQGASPEGKTIQDVRSGLLTEEAGQLIIDRNRERELDANGFLRFVDDGKRVFPEVEELEEELSGKEKFDRAKDIRGEIFRASTDFTKVADAWDRISASAADPSAAGDLALIFNFMKMLDPGSTVREGEFATAQNSASVPGRLRSLYNNVTEGERLNEDQRADFLDQGQNLFESAADRNRFVVDDFVRLAERNGLAREDVVIERGPAPVIGGPAPGAGGLDTSGLPTVTTQQEFDAIPVGAQFIEDGETRTKL